MKVKLKPFDGVYKDTRSGYKSKSYGIVNSSAAGDLLLGRVFITVRLDTENKQVGIEKMLFMPCLEFGEIERDIVSDYGGLGYWFKTDTPKMCSSEDDLRANVCFIIELAMKMVSGVIQPARTALYIAGITEPHKVDSNTIDKRFFTYELDFCKHWLVELLPKKLMKLVEPKPKPEAKPTEARYTERPYQDKSVNEYHYNVTSEILDDQSHPATGPDDNPPGFIM